MSDIVIVNDENFEKEVLQSLIPVLVDVGAEWCGPCHKQLPIMEQFATQNKGRVKVCTVDVDDSPGTTVKYNIRSVPTIILFFQGQKLDAKTGVTNAAVLEALVLEKTGR